MRVGIDLDGVCYDFAASLHAHLGRTEPFTEPTRWEFYEDWGLDLPAFLAACHAGVDAGVVFTHGAPFPGVPEAFDLLHAAGHTVHVVTDRSFGTAGASEAATRAWLDRHGLRFHSLTFTADKTIARVDTMVDDKLANYDALAAVGVDVRLLDRPWNQTSDQHRRRTPSLLHYAQEMTR